ncbi:hypothetical protein [Streptomyces corynorhini]|uniref:Uncharacterized protein n=1 Tax=Streptomyces corynorhini TaxID=2282652 RepID=A0A370B8D7_9ACTN|nr:hypothetical protein [Streptomyces corynorhini]RDG38070.1 hypothetical protein DVH02_11135 [Streptomyces corynorhini]
MDHPTTIDLSRLAAALKMPASALKNTELPGHDHIITDRNNNRPERWPVYVVAVTDPGSFAEIQAGKSFDTVKKLAANPSSGVSQPIPTDTFPWFQTLPGTNGGGPARSDTPSGGVAAGSGGTQNLRGTVLMTAAGVLTVGSVGALVVSRRKNAAARA